MVGPSIALADVAEVTRSTWGRDGVILLSQGPASQIQRVPENGGNPVRVTTESQGVWAPQLLPDGRHFLYFKGGTGPATGVYVAALDGATTPVRLLADVAMARYAPSAASDQTGHLLFVRDTTLLAQPFDARTLQFTGEIVV